MTRIPQAVQLTVALALFAFGMVGVTNSVHLAAKIIYALLIAVTSAFITHLAERTRADRTK